MNFNLSSPATSGGPNFPKNEHLDHLILFLGPIERRELETSFGPGTAAHVPTLICTDCIESWADQLVFGAALEPRGPGGAAPHR
jgi:hypothetical protein